MIVDNVWKLTNTVRVGMDARSSHARRQSSFPDNVCSCCPPRTVCHTLKIPTKNHYFLVFFKKISIPRAKMVKRSDKTNTGEGGKGKKSRTVSDDSGGKSLSDTSTSAGVKSTAIRTSVNIFEASKRDKPQYFVDKVKDKQRTKSNNLEFLIGWRGFPDPKEKHSAVLCAREKDGC